MILGHVRSRQEQCMYCNTPYRLRMVFVLTNVDTATDVMLFADICLHD